MHQRHVCSCPLAAALAAALLIIVSAAPARAQGSVSRLLYDATA